ncbi:hypothetical protein RJ639_002684 [Escallonia herrerae]|uniref:Reverse transcriptase RNase H-like domain-containing protein n=1 Tax=Escallonia herrerae TaxID=1293975 RepID=A0AA89BNN5_9ASTE|nr:hypothetical protein RJ639_002684 [Escallonia herrerae]
MKFPTEYEVGEVKGDQTTARQCYMASCRSKNKEALMIEDLREDTKMQRGKPVEELVSIEVYLVKEIKTVWIGSNLKDDTKFELLSVTEVAVNTVLVRKKDGVQKPIYYVSKVLQDVETRYPKIDKIALALIILARHLRPPTTWKGLLSPEASGRLVNWSVELGEFNIQYKPRTAIKVQALADFIVKCTSLEDPPQLVISEVPDPWNLYVDGSSAIGSSGAGIILISPEASKIKNFTIRQIARDQNAQVDTLSRLASAEVTDV